jgi:hypothetical protein
MLQLKIDLTVEDEAEAEALTGTRDTEAGQATVELLCGDGATGIVEVAIKGTAPAIIAWMAEAWQDESLAIFEFEEGVEHGKLTKIAETE